MADKIRLMHISENYGGLGGAEKVVIDLMERLDRDKYEIQLALVGDEKFRSHYEKESVKLYHLPSPDGFSLKFVNKLSSLFKSEKIDISHSHLIRMNTFNALASLKAKTKAVGTIHGIMTDEYSYKSKLYIKTAARLCKKTVLVSDSLKKQFVTLFGVNENKLVVINNAFDSTRIENRPTDEKIERFKKNQSSAGSSPVIAAVGNIYEVKGYRYLIEAVASLKKKYPDIRLFIAGKTDLIDKLGLTQRVVNKGLQKNVTFLGTFTDLPLLFEQSDLYVSSSIHEGFSLTTVEAMAYGLPVVVTRCGGPEDIVVEGKTGLIAEPKSSQSLAEKISTVLDDPIMMSQFSRNGKQRAYEMYSMDKFIEGYDKLYCDLMDSKR